jgi:hypothetical protein
MTDEDRTRNGADAGTYKCAAESMGGDSTNGCACRGGAKNALIRRASGERDGRRAGDYQNRVSHTSVLHVEFDATVAACSAVPNGKQRWIPLTSHGVSGIEQR